MTNNDFHFRGDDDSDLDAFEQQLRSVKPTPPETAWQDLLISREHQKATTRSGIGSATTRWPRVATHAAATLIGIGIGVVCMLMLRPAVAVLPPIESASQQVAIEPQLPEAAPKYIPVQRSYRHREFRTSRPLTPLARNIDARPWQRTPPNVRSVSLEEPTSTLELDESDKPMSAHELMRELLNSQVNLPSRRDQNFSHSL